MASIQCKLDIPEVRGLKDQELTVGREFYLNCTGDWPKNLKQEALHFEGDSEQKYHLKLFTFEFRNPTTADLKVTSYLAGKQAIPNLVLTDGETKVDLGTLQFEVASVIEKTEEKVEPYGAIGPASIPIPLLYWVLLVGVILVSAALFGLRVWRFNQRKAMLERLKEHDLALSPLQEFHQSMRRLQRSNSVFYGKEASPEELRSGVGELERMFKVYLSRQLKVPAFEWNERLVLKDIRRYHRQVYDNYDKKIRDLFIEFKKAHGSQQSLKARDVTQLSETLRKVLEGIDKLLLQQDNNTSRRGGHR